MEFGLPITKWSKWIGLASQVRLNSSPLFQRSSRKILTTCLILSARFAASTFCRRGQFLKNSGNMALFYYCSYGPLVVLCCWASEAFRLFIIGANPALFPARGKLAFLEKDLQIKGLSQNRSNTLS